VEAEAGNGPDVPGERVVVRGGLCVNPGAACGPVSIVESDADAARFPEGAVLVVAQPLPRWATATSRAAAVVAGKGSVAGHLASVAREYGIPALFGATDAVEALESGRTVTVDSRGCRIYEGRVESLLAEQEAPRNLMAGSPVYEALANTSRHITPLTMLDPDAPTFVPRHCETLHDITRFCHEFAVREMFLFGKEHTFPERSSKQLICEVPMQWWVLNLDDGFSEEVEGGQVHLSTIVSIPMLALWDGINAYPWEGPPPMDGKGFLSVMFEATRNTSLVPGMRSNYTDRNYFMISRNYCSLTSRLGFHFSTVESLVSKRSGENYISFRFKGGAADSARRGRRILFISELLEENGFRVDVKEDHLSARSEDHDPDKVIERLKVLGYLIIHTRQLDMIMSNDAMVSQYRARMRGEIAEILGGGEEMPQAGS
jgi:pyruvate,water dikinase